MEHIRILLLGVSFRVYRSYKIRSRQKVEKIEKVEMAETREVRKNSLSWMIFTKIRLRPR